MAIRAIIEGGRDISPLRVKELAKGEKDKHGNSFEIISLMAVSSDGRGSGSRFHIAGYQDTFITIKDNGNVSIDYGQPGMGNIQFEKNELGRLIGEVAKTPWNLATLAAQIAAGDKQWRIMDPEQEKEVREAAKKVRVSEDTIETQKQKEIKAEQKAKVDAEAELKRQIELSQKNDKLKEIEEKSTETDITQESFPGKNKLLAELVGMNHKALKTRATACGADRAELDREKLVAVIVEYESKKAKGEMVVE